MPTLARALGHIAVISLLAAGYSARAGERELSITKQLDGPVLTIRSAGAEGNKYGFEGGRVIKLNGTYHLFTSEMVGEPHWVKMKLAHWVTEDKMHWRRVDTLLESSGDFTGADSRAALWSPMPIFNPSDQTWNLFYVAYHAAPDTQERWLTNHEGRIWRATSVRPGIDGIDGPYKDVGIVLQRGKDSDSWEGLQGTDSFFPYNVGETWYALYGSARTEHLPIELWQVGLAQASELGGPWKRCSKRNPLKIEPRFIENPIVTKLADGTYVAVYDNHQDNKIGYSFSEDGIHWSAGRQLMVQRENGIWASEVRTPLGLIDEGNNSYTLFYSANEKVAGAQIDANGITLTPGAIGVVEVRLEPELSGSGKARSTNAQKQER